MATPITLMIASYSLGIIMGKFMVIPPIFLILVLGFIFIAAISLFKRRQSPFIILMLAIFIAGAVACQLSVPHIASKVPSRNPIVILSMAIKDRLLSVIQRTMEEPYSSLLGSIIFGSTASPLPSEFQENYRTAGVIHLLVVSGTQVSIIVSVISNVCKSIGMSLKLQFISVTAANILFTVMTGAGPSIIRAAVMAQAALLANALGRENDFYNSLSLSALALMMIDPLNLFDLGFQLSFIATWALFYVAPIIENKLLAVLPVFLANLSAISVAPTIATTPIILYNFGQISFISVVSNFLILPWVEVTVILGFASTIIGLFILPIAYAINNTLTIMLALLNCITGYFAQLPFACGYYAPPVFVIILLYYVWLIWWIESMRCNSAMKYGKSVLIAVIISALTFHFAFAGEKGLTVTVLDVGQGDSIIVESPSGKKMLIDGGEGGKKNYAASRIVVPSLRKKGITKLDYLVLTHPHSDHVGGLPYLLGKIKVDSVLDSGQANTSSDYYRFLKAIDTKKIHYKISRTGDIIDLGDGATALVVNPSQPLISGTTSDLNNNSIVIKLVYGKTSFLLAGDVGVEGEDRVMSAGYDLKSDVLKVGHHGSKYSSSNAFLADVKPKYAIISVGRNNKFGHPSARVLNELSARGISVYRTDINGQVTMKSDGTNIIITTAK